jgi:hypothetical protein
MEIKPMPSWAAGLQRQMPSGNTASICLMLWMSSKQIDAFAKLPGV